MKEEYKEELSKIKAPQELVEETKIEMRKEMLKKNQAPAETAEARTRKAPIVKITVRQTAIVSAAVLLIIVGTFSYVRSQTQITIQAVSESAMTLNPNLGRMSEKGSKTNDQIKVMSATDHGIIPEFLESVKKSKIKGQSIQLGRDKNGVYYGAYEREGTYYYVTGVDVTEDEFIDFFKNQF